MPLWGGGGSSTGTRAAAPTGRHRPRAVTVVSFSTARDAASNQLPLPVAGYACKAKAKTAINPRDAWRLRVSEVGLAGREGARDRREHMVQKKKNLPSPVTTHTDPPHEFYMRRTSSHRQASTPARCGALHNRSSMASKGESALLPAYARHKPWTRPARLGNQQRNAAH
jgi:hypothetical protein